MGLAGKACAGKDTLVGWFTQRGFTEVDADKIGHRALEANREAVLARFGTLDRPSLGRLVFSDPRALADLEALTHPWIAQEVRRQVEAVPHAVVHAALLHKMGLWRLCDAIVWVQAPLWTRILRARARDGWGWKRIWDRIWAQRKLGPHVFGPDVDILIVDNRGTPGDSQRLLEARFGREPAIANHEVNHEKQ